MICKTIHTDSYLKNTNQFLKIPCVFLISQIPIAHLYWSIWSTQTGYSSPESQVMVFHATSYLSTFSWRCQELNVGLCKAGALSYVHQLVEPGEFLKSVFSFAQNCDSIRKRTQSSSSYIQNLTTLHLGFFEASLSKGIHGPTQDCGHMNGNQNVILK